VPEGKVVTFYSYKGGTGRTMALANTAWILASNGYKVLVVDWDLDSPGLHKFFRPFLDRQKITATPGVLDLINDYQWAATRDEERPDDWHVDYAQITKHAISLSWPDFPDGGTLDYVSAGRQNRDYSSDVVSIDWDNLYERLGAGQFFDAMRRSMKEEYDYTLIDSRTGLNDIADICTVHLPDILVDCFTLSDQSVEGAAAVAKNVANRYHYRNIRVLPVAMRIENTEKEKVDVGLAWARHQFGLFPMGLTEEEAAKYWKEVIIPYQPFYAFEETLASFGDSPGGPYSLLAAFERLTAAVTENRVTKLPEMAEDTRLTYLDAFTRRRLPPQTDIYLSYVSEDRMWADWVATLLEAEGIRVQHAGRTHAGGNAREQATREADAASTTVAIVSRTYAGSPEAWGVWDAMARRDPVALNRRLIPIRVAAGVTGPFAERVVIDLTRRDEGQAVEELRRAFGLVPRSAAPGGLRAPRYPRTIPPVWQVPNRNASFTGRSEELERLRDQLVGGSTAVVLPVALYGLGGVGKTQVALEYAHRYMADYDVVWWVPAEQQDRIDPALADLAPHLSVRAGDSFSDTAMAVREALRKGDPYSRWLLIFDNADEPDDLRPFFPGGPGGPGHVLVTSRNTAWSEDTRAVRVDVFDRPESIEHLQRRVSTLTESDATLVAEALGDLPLAIEQAGAWLATTGMTVPRYVEALQTQFAQILDLGQPSNYPKPVAATWRLSFDRLREQSPAAARLLELCAFFSPDPISLSLLNGAEMIHSLLPYDARLTEPIVLGQLIRDISRFSLAKVDPGSSIEVHRLIQAAMRAQISSQQEREDAMHEVHRILVGAQPRSGTDDPATWAQWDVIWPHLGPSEAYDCDHDEPRQLLIDRVRYLYKRFELKQALSAGYQLEERWVRKLGPDHRQTLYLRFHIANVLRSLGRYQDAHDQDAEILERQRQVLPMGHPHPLQTAGSLAADLRGLGRFADALAMDTQTHERTKELFGDDHASTLSAANNLGVNLRLLGASEDARAIDIDTLNRRNQVLGHRHPSTLHSASMLARDQREMGDYKESVEALRGTYDTFMHLRDLGEDYPDTLRTAKNLAVSLRKMGRPGEAYELTRDTSERYKRNFPAEDQDALACRLSLACDLAALGRLNEALEVATDVLRAYERTLGGDHPFTLAAANNIVSYLRGTGSTSEAVKLADITLRSLQNKLGDRHPFTMACAVNRANCLHALDQLSSAEIEQQSVGQRMKEVLGPSHPDAILSDANLAVTMRARRSRAAPELQLQTISALAGKLGEDHPSVVALKSWKLQDLDIEAQPM
jgi:TIR domain/Tetratricopeptide repeat/NB-ARC domain/CobQ/CobB/MinD/ParA nucleotide binding domain